MTFIFSFTLNITELEWGRRRIEGDSSQRVLFLRMAHHDSPAVLKHLCQNRLKKGHKLQLPEYTDD